MLFAGVDVGTMAEREVDGAKIPLPYIIRAAKQAIDLALGSASCGARERNARARRYHL